jgi:Ca2+:H+ antiporter
MAVPVLRELTPTARFVVLAAVAMSVLAIAMEYVLKVGGTPLFFVSAAAILGLAFVVGLSTERLGEITGPQAGAVINATFGNVAELIIAYFALQAGLLEVVKASITGSIIGNLLFVLGASLLLGGLRHGRLHFNAKVASLDATLLFLAVIGLFVPAVFASGGTTAAPPAAGAREEESIVTAAVLIVLYVLSLVYRFRHPQEVGSTGEEGGAPAWTARVAAGVLVATAVAIAVLAEILVEAIDPFIAQFGFTAFFVGVILIPVIGNLAENLVAVQLAAKGHIDFAIAVPMNSSIQIALFVAPMLVIIGALTQKPMDLVFAPLEVAAVGVAAVIAALISLDGESNWLEGALLVGVYLILGVSFFYLR